MNPRDLVAAARAGDRLALAQVLGGWAVSDATLAAGLARLSRAVPWSSEPLVRSPEVSLDLFFMPQGASIPLHDHPGMFGLMRVLRGSLSLQAYVWEDRSAGLARPLPPARGTPSVAPPAIDPAPGLVHQVTALEDAAFMDLFTPPYDPAGDRPCTYYALTERRPDGLVRLVPTAS